jgi:hypothetical protein
MPAIFISYRGEDTISATGRLADVLAVRGLTEILRDVEAIEAGADFVCLLYEPRRFLAARGAGAQNELTRAFLFVLVSQPIAGMLTDAPHLTQQFWPRSLERGSGTHELEPLDGANCTLSGPDSDHSRVARAEASADIADSAHIPHGEMG